jgi:outer membrane biosynthesis protein TonB
MREESHLDEMRSAIRGDFERLAERRGEQELMRVEAEPEPPDDEPVASAPVDEPEPAPEPEPEPEPEDRRSWLARFLSP